MPQVVYGHLAANAEGDYLVVWKDESRSSEWMRFTFPRQRKEPWLCISDFFRPKGAGAGDEDYASFMLCTIGARASEQEAACLFAENRYTDYLFLHGLSAAQMAEALAEYWHRRIREELGFAGEDGPDSDRPVPPEVPGRSLLVGLPGLPRPDRQREGGGAARRGSHWCDGDRGVPAEPRADDRRHYLFPTPRRSTSWRRSGSFGSQPNIWLRLLAQKKKKKKKKKKR